MRVFLKSRGERTWQGRYLGDVDQVDDCKVFHRIGNTGQDLIHLHADRIRIVSKSNDDGSVFLLQ